ncbi:MAG: tetratricopeptide repeat protein [Dehalococcoidia bacterium]
MSTFTDRSGLPLTTSSARAADLYREGIDLMLAGGFGGEAMIEEALQEDAGFSLARVTHARNLQLRGRVQEARDLATLAQETSGDVTRRERQHVDVIATAITDSGEQALAKVREHVAEFPRDAYVLSQANGVYGLIGFSGHINRNDEQLDLLESVAPAYGEDWWFLGALSFAYNELFQSLKARPLAERSVELREGNAHGAHSVAHVCFELGDTAAGTSFLDAFIPGCDERASLHQHLAWHNALFQLREGNVERALDLFETYLRPGANRFAPPINQVVDPAAFLWRLEAYGHQADPAAWTSLRDDAARFFQRPGVMFADVHCALAYAGAGDEAALGLWIEALRKREAEGKVSGGPIVVKLAEAAASFATGDYDRVVETLEPSQHEVVRIGGSHAQRELWEDTLIAAYLRSGRGEQAADLLRKRLGRRPSPADYGLLAEATTAA